MTKQIEIAYSKSGFVRLIQKGNLFEVQCLVIRSQNKLGSATYWKTFCGIWDRARAIESFEMLAA